jgi:hypothetical protein
VGPRDEREDDGEDDGLCAWEVVASLAKTAYMGVNMIFA